CPTLFCVRIRRPLWSRRFPYTTLFRSVWLAGVGAFGGWVASLAGLIDLLTVAEIRRKITAWCHAILAVMMLSLASLNWLLRYETLLSDAVVLWALYLSVLTAGLIGLAAFLGGRLVYEHAVGVQTE